MIGRRMMVGMVAGLLVVGFAGSSAVMGAKGDKKGQKLEQRVDEQVSERMPGQRLEAALGDLGLSEEQKGKVGEILKPFKEEVGKWREDHKAELEKVRTDLVAAREAKDREKGKAAMQDLRKLLEGAPKPAEVVGKLKDVLTADQMAKLQAKMEEGRGKGRKGKGN